jgi:hypothetical protein
VLQFLNAWRYPLNGFLRKQNAFKRFFKQLPDGTELRSFQKGFMKEVPMELDGDLEDLSALTFVGKPGMWNIGAYKHKFQVIDLLHTVTYYTLDPFGVFDKVQFIFFMEM